MKGIRIENLYERFSYEIMLSESGLTILTGPNGFGKSTILHIIRAIADSNIKYFFDLVFSKIEILQEDSKENFVINKVEGTLEIDDYRFNKQEFANWRRGLDDKASQSSDGSCNKQITDIVFKMQKVTGSVFFIVEQRLIKYTLRMMRSRISDNKVAESNIIQAVEEISDKMKDNMGKAADNYSKISNELDSTFPQRLFAQKAGLTQEEFNDKLNSMRKNVSKLQRYGITDIKRFDDIQFKEEDARALKVYFQDFDEKYQQYEKLINKLEIFTDVVNRRFKFKKITISRRDGICIEDEAEHKIPLSKLSSGEKETLVLFYQMIFEVPENSILLIDEPEISLHIAWQRMFVKDIERIIQGTGIQAIIATHSVQIVNGNKRIQRDLGRQYSDGDNKQ